MRNPRAFLLAVAAALMLAGPAAARPDYMDDPGGGGGSGVITSCGVDNGEWVCAAWVCDADGCVRLW